MRQRADQRCEYCQTHQDDSPLAALHVEHIRPLKHGGTDDDSNLCLACIDCNLHKGPNLTGVDPLSDLVTLLYHPRQQRWDNHFHWEGIIIAGRSDVGRRTNDHSRALHEQRRAVRTANGWRVIPTTMPLSCQPELYGRPYLADLIH